MYLPTLDESYVVDEMCFFLIAFLYHLTLTNFKAFVIKIY